MRAYLDILKQINDHGKRKLDRTGVGTISSFATRFRHDLRNGFPLLTTKKINPVLPLVEMFAFFKGATHLKDFHALECKIWDKWGLEKDFGEWVRKTDVEVAEDIRNFYLFQNGNEIDSQEALSILEGVRTAYGNHHGTLRKITAEYSTEPHDVAMGKITKWMVDNPEPPSEAAWLKDRQIGQFKYNIIYPKGYLGPIYGAQWLGWKTPDGRTINQLHQVVSELRTNPNSRRIVLLGWNPADISDGKLNIDENNQAIRTSSDRIQANIMEGKMALPPCHLMTIFNVDTSGDVPVLNLHQIMRSSDVPVGLPFNIAGYAYFLKLVAHQLGYIAGELVIDTTDAHIYTDQVDLVPTQLSRDPKPLPTLDLPKDMVIDIVNPDSLTLDLAKSIVECITNYEPHAFIPYPVTI